MLLSFSVPSMLPMIRAGLRQRAGEDVGCARVKRQTIRPRGPRAEQLLAWARRANWTHPYDLHLWWKSRTKEREMLGVVEGGGHIFPITILHGRVEPPNGEPYEVYRIDGPPHYRDGDTMLFWDPQHGGEQFVQEARADGFDNAADFVRFFVPNLGDVFEGALFKW